MEWLWLPGLLPHLTEKGITRLPQGVDSLDYILILLFR